MKGQKEGTYISSSTARILSSERPFNVRKRLFEQILLYQEGTNLNTTSRAAEMKIPEIKKKIRKFTKTSQWAIMRPKI